jgi:hypothetical protein
MPRRGAELESLGMDRRTGLDAETHTEMNAARFQISVRWMMALVAVVAAGLTVTSGHQTTYRSCHLCHNRIRVDSRLALGFPVSWHETMETRFPTTAGHQHVWWSYARSTSGFMQGIEAAGNSSSYVDGSTAPDGRR